jgi:hypothetical protein
VRVGAASPENYMRAYTKHSYRKMQRFKIQVRPDAFHQDVIAETPDSLQYPNQRFRTIGDRKNSCTFDVGSLVGKHKEQAEVQTPIALEKVDFQKNY